MDKEKAERIKTIDFELRVLEINRRKLEAELSMLTNADIRTPIKDLGLKTGARNALFRAGYMWIEQLIEMEDLTDLYFCTRCFGKKSLSDVERKLAEWQSSAQNTTQDVR